LVGDHGVVPSTQKGPSYGRALPKISAARVSLALIWPFDGGVIVLLLLLLLLQLLLGTR